MVGKQILGTVNQQFGQFEREVNVCNGLAEYQFYVHTENNLQIVSLSDWYYILINKGRPILHFAFFSLSL